MKTELCHVCRSKSVYKFSKVILGKYTVKYFQCNKCGFMQLEKPYWLSESYVSAITSMDIGLIKRNLLYSNIVEELIYNHFNPNRKYLDYAGGYGVFTRIMRDKGFDYYHQDEFCENLFAKYFDIKDIPKKNRKFELTTSFELMEHLENPFKTLDYIFSISNNFLFTTEMIPDSNIENWWYLGLEHGQHISFYTKEALEFIAKKYNKKYYSTINSLHLFADINIEDPFLEKSLVKEMLDKVSRRINPRKLLITKTQSDFEYIRKSINDKF